MHVRRLSDGKETFLCDAGNPGRDSTLDLVRSLTAL